MDVAYLREQISACQRMTYLNTGWQGPSPLRVLKAIEDRLRLEAMEGPTTPAVWESVLETRTEARQAVATLLNASIDEICLTPRTTDGLTTVVNGLRWSEGDEVITFAAEHPAVLIACHLLQRQHGVHVRLLPLASDETDASILDKVESAITPRTRCLFFSHVQYASGLRMPIPSLRAMTKPRGIRMLVDGAQTGGHLALDMRALDCDFYAIPGQKWLLGPNGTGALFIREELIEEVEPRQAGFRTLVDPESHPSYDEYQVNTGSIEKFAAYSPSAALQLGFLEAVRFNLEIGPQEIEARSLALASRAKASLADVPGVTVLSPMDPVSSSGLVTVALGGVDPKEAVARLWEERRIVIRPVNDPSGIRLSLAWFNTEDEVDETVDAIRELAAE